MNRARRYLASCVVGSALAAGCSVLGGFDDLHAGCPAGLVLGPAGNAGLPTCVGGGGSGGKKGSGGARAEGTGGEDIPGGAGSGATAGHGENGSGGRATSGGRDAGGPPGTTGDARASACTGKVGPGPAMAPIIRADGSVFLIDRTEVTFGQYAEFLRTPQGSSNSTVCPEGDSAVVPPECAAMPSDDADDDPSELPRVCVDWCGADAYCKWAGKELCADATQGTESALQAKSDFYAACSSGGSRYGCSGCQAPQCNGIDAHFGKVEPVGTLPECTIGAAGCEVSDLSGNVAEWTAICTPATPTGSCATRGGSYQSSESELACSALGSLPRRHMSVTVGFRCCIHDWPR